MPKVSVAANSKSSLIISTKAKGNNTGQQQRLISNDTKEMRNFSWRIFALFFFRPYHIRNTFAWGILTLCDKGKIIEKKLRNFVEKSDIFIHIYI